MAKRKLTVMIDDRLYDWLVKEAERNFTTVTEVTKRYLLAGMKAHNDFEAFLKSIADDNGKQTGA